MIKELEYPFDSVGVLRKKRALKKRCLEQRENWLEIRIAVLCGSTVADICDILELFLLNEGIRPQFYQSEFGKYWEDAVFDNPELEHFRPQVIWIHTSTRNINSMPDITDSENHIKDKLKQEEDKLLMMWEQLEKRYGCPIIQNNFERPLYRILGNQDIADEAGGSNFVFRLNDYIYRYKQSHANFYVHDVDGISSCFGLRSWQEPRYWYLYKYALNINAIPEFSYNLFTIVKSLFGKNKKVLALDADNTLWGGVIGDCGAENIELGAETASGQMYLEWQQYIRRLKKCGILLAIVSKNEQKSVEEGLEHPSGVLRAKDFAVVRSNWENKDINLQYIAEALNIGLEQIVFIDDNPAERRLVETNLPMVSIVNEDKAERFIQVLDAAGYFESTVLTKEDLKRNEMYRENEKRSRFQETFVDYDDFLKNLQMKAVIKKFEPLYVSRITQLINKTNQFNFTMLRCTEEEVRRIMLDSSYMTLYGQLSDVFGDNGIVSLMIGEKKNSILHICLFVMSCRVFKRNMEYAMMDAAVVWCMDNQIEKIKGYYIPGAKNQILKEKFAEFGFVKQDEDENGNSTWELEIDHYQNKNHVISL
jgi:FkbH-like protein